MPRPLDSTPAADGFRMPAEWEPHAGCWMAWPERPDNWRAEAGPAQAAYAAVASAIAASEPVTMAVSDASVRGAPGRRSRTRCGWSRSPPTTPGCATPARPSSSTGRAGGAASTGASTPGAAHDGGLYSPWDRDDRVAAKVLEVEGDGRYRAPIVLEGGAIHVDGEGTVLTTEQCLLNRNRNPELDRAAIEAALHAYLGTEKVVWLGEGVFEDETDGHVDNLAAFARPGVVLLTWVEDPADPQHAISARRAGAPRGGDRRPGPPLRGGEGARARAADDRPPRRRPGSKPSRAPSRAAPATGWRPATSTSTSATRASSTPCSTRPATTRPAEILAATFPDREVVGVPAREILLGGGNIHCITQQVPAE